MLPDAALTAVAYALVPHPSAPATGSSSRTDRSPGRCGARRRRGRGRQLCGSEWRARRRRRLGRVGPRRGRDGEREQVECYARCGQLPFHHAVQDLAGRGVLAQALVFEVLLAGGTLGCRAVARLQLPEPVVDFDLAGFSLDGSDAVVAAADVGPLDIGQDRAFGRGAGCGRGWGRGRGRG